MNGVNGVPAHGGASLQQDPGPAAQKGVVVFRHRDFRLLILGKLFASLSLHMVMVVIGYQIYDLTGDPMNLAYIGLAIFAPVLGFALLAGYVVDRFDRRLVLAGCYLVMLISARCAIGIPTAGSSVMVP